MVPLPADRVEAFERWLSERWWAASWFTRRGALWCSYGLLGLRWSEVEVIRPEDLCEADLSLDVRTAKRGCRRRIEVPQGVVEASLRLRAEVEGGADRLFTRRNGRPLVYQDQVRFTAAATKCVFGRRYTFHCFRHTAAVRVYERTHDVLAVQRYLGHKSLMWTNSYLRSLLVVEVGGAVAFCGGGWSVPRVFDPDDRLGRTAVVRGVASRGKAAAGGDEEAFAVDAAAAEAKGPATGHACVVAELAPVKHGSSGVGWRCAGCGAIFVKDGVEVRKVAEGEPRVSVSRLNDRYVNGVEGLGDRVCETVHASVEERWGPGGMIEVWCADCGKYLGPKVRRVRPARAGKGPLVDQQGRLW